MGGVPRLEVGNEDPRLEMTQIVLTMAPRVSSRVTERAEPGDVGPQPCPLSYAQPWPGVYKLLGKEPWWALESDLLGLRPLTTQHLEERLERTGGSSL